MSSVDPHTPSQPAYASGAHPADALHPAAAPSPGSALTPIPDDLQIEAQQLLTHAIRTGQSVDTEILTPLESKSPASNDFLEAYAKLAQLMHPVTAQSLIDTDPQNRQSIAARWSRRMMAYTFAILFVLLATELLRRCVTLGQSAACSDPTSWVADLKLFFMTLEPFAYGGLGACAELLRTCHTYTGNRTFNRAKRDAYISQLVLGIIAGGTAMLLMENILNDGTQINISSAALAFIAGFKVDFLYQAISRVAEAILPKVGATSASTNAQQGWQPPPIISGKVNAHDLLAMVNDPNATAEAKTAATKLLNGLTNSTGKGAPPS